MLIQTNERPSKGYKIGMVLVALCALALVVFLFVSGAVSLFKAALLTLGVGTLVFFYAVPLLAKRHDYIGPEPKVQVVKLRLLPYGVFAGICMAVAVYGLLSAA